MAKRQIEGTVPSVQRKQRSMRIAVQALDRTTKAVNKNDNQANRNARTRALSRVRVAREALQAEEARRKSRVKRLTKKNK